jgi:hypothetical protein
MTIKKAAAIILCGLFMLAGAQPGSCNSILLVSEGVSSFDFSVSVNSVSRDYLALNAAVFGNRDPSLCGECMSGWSDTFAVRMYGPDKDLLASYQGTDYFFQNCCSDTHNSAPPFFFAIPRNTESFDILNQLTILGSVASEGELFVSANSSMSQTPLPSTFGMMLAGLLGLLCMLTGWRRLAAFRIEAS